METEKSQRWWEFYLVRYFVGTVCGTLIVLVLVFHEKSKVYELIKSSDQITTLINDFKPIHLWLYGFIGLAYCYISSGPILFFHAIRGLFRKTQNTHSAQNTNNRFIKAQLIKILIYYSELSEHRAKRKNNEKIKEYIESYKHLREHGNAFFIVLFEIVLGVLLFISPWWLMICIFFIWAIAGTLVWFIGTYLERELMNFAADGTPNNHNSNS